MRGRGSASRKPALYLPPPQCSSHCTCPDTPRGACWEWARAQAFPGEGRGRAAPGAAPRAAPGAGRCPSTHPRLERLKGGKAQPRTAFLSRSRAARLRSWSGCSRCRRFLLVGFTKGGEGPEVDATTARAAGRGKGALGQAEPPTRADVGRACAHAARPFSPPRAEFREARPAGVTRTLTRTQWEAHRGVRAYDPLISPTASFSGCGNCESEVECST